MKTIRFFSLVLLTVLFCTSYANEPGSISDGRNETRITVTSQNSKIYIHPENVMFDKHEMYVRLNQNWVQTNSLYSDDRGLYMIDSYSGWTCPKCNKQNTDRWQCSKCGYRPYNEKIENN